jgi:GNAT superfamily N-acetyltransferase
MAKVRCICGVDVESEQADGLFAAMRAHCDVAHADLNITDEMIQRNLDIAGRLAPWDGQPAPLPGPIEIHPLTAERQEDFLAYFDREAFADNPAWASCYCFFYRFDGGRDAWPARGYEENRAAQAAEIASGRASGLLAYADGRVVGWCHVAPRGDLPLLDAGPTEHRAERVASVVCFNVKPAHRGMGVAKVLLDAACAEMAGRGFTIVEGYPMTGAPRDNAQAYHGPLKMYEDAGFTKHGEFEHFTIVRKTLR